MFTLKGYGGLERTGVRTKKFKEKSIICSFQVVIAEKNDIENHYHRANYHCCQWKIFAVEVSSHNHY